MTEKMSGGDGGSAAFQPQTYICWGVGGKMRIEVCRSFPSAGVMSGKGLPPGVFHRLGSLRLRKPCGLERIATGATVRAFEQRMKRRMLTAQRGRHLTQLRLTGRFISRGGGTRTGLEEQTITLQFRRLWDQDRLPTGIGYRRNHGRKRSETKRRATGGDWWTYECCNI